MSYSYINDAFNMNNNKNIKFSSDPANNDIQYSNYDYIKSPSSSKNTNFDNVDDNNKSCNKSCNKIKEFSMVNVPNVIDNNDNYDSPTLEIFNINELDFNNYEPPYDNNSLSLNGTNIANLLNDDQLKLTHRDCVNIYNNPEFFSENHITFSLKHISKCSMCKQEIIKSKKDIEIQKQQK